jgi:hypothetical protein
MSYIQSLEAVDSSSFAATIMYAKFSIYAKQMDWQAAESSLKSLLLKPLSFEMAIDAVKTLTTVYCQLQASSDIIVEDFVLAHFAKLFNKFPK